MMNEEFCPMCNGILNDQPGYESRLNVWICKECGQPLLNPNSEEDTVWFCDNCYDILNNQCGFDFRKTNKFSCTNCGLENYVGGDKIISFNKRHLLK